MDLEQLPLESTAHRIFRDHITHFLHFHWAELDFQGTNILLHTLDPLCP